MDRVNETTELAAGDCLKKPWQYGQVSPLFSRKLQVENICTLLWKMRVNLVKGHAAFYLSLLFQLLAGDVAIRCQSAVSECKQNRVQSEAEKGTER